LSLQYYYFSNRINSSKLFEAVLKSDLKRIENFKEKFDLEKFKQRSKKYKKLEDYWHKEFDENFFNLIEQLKKYMRIPDIKIPQEFPIDASGLTDNLIILTLYLSFYTSTERDVYCLDKYFDRYNFDYDIDIKSIKEEIDLEIRDIFLFSSNLANTFRHKDLPIEVIENLFKNFRGGRKLTHTKETKYKLVVEYITIMEKHFNLSAGIQRIACELAKENQYSFSAWKNAKNKTGKKKNFDTYLKWREEKIPSKKNEELKTNIENYLKSL